MALCQSSSSSSSSSSCLQLCFHSIRRLFSSSRSFSTSPRIFYSFLNKPPLLLHPSLSLSRKFQGYYVVSNGLNSVLPGVVYGERNATSYTKATFLHHDALLSSEERAVNDNPSDGRLMLIDGTSIIYRAYYKLLAKLHHGYLSHADGNGDWVLTVFTALSLIIDVLEFVPSHVAVVFDHDGFPFGQTYNSSKESFMAKD